MRIKLISEFKSIKNLNEIDLPSFVIITGLNGAGKTQLLQAISTKKAIVKIADKSATNIKMFSGGLGDIGTSDLPGNFVPAYILLDLRRTQSDVGMRHIMGVAVVKILWVFCGFLNPQ